MTSVREQINFVQYTFAEESVRPVNGTITFPPIDVNQVLQPHENVLILMLKSGKFDVRRILVYSSSLANLLQMSAYRQVGYSPSALKNPGCLPSEFNGATTTSLGDVVLPVQVGRITLSVRFSVVDDISPYNAIMGRA